jgi:hypothetical protein
METARGGEMPRPDTKSVLLVEEGRKKWKAGNVIVVSVGQQHIGIDRLFAVDRIAQGPQAGARIKNE